MDTESRSSPKPALCASPVKELDFSDDDGEAILLLLRIAHLKFNYVTNHEPDTLYEVALLCHKYDCAHLARPWYMSWDLGRDFREAVFPNPQWMVIAWVFGNQSLFDNVSIAAVKNVLTNDAGQCLLNAETVLEDGFLSSIGIISEYFLEILSPKFC